jgi:hypothetical protein
MRDQCAAPKIFLRCVCTRRRNCCIGQLSPFQEYAPSASRIKPDHSLHKNDPLPGPGCSTSLDRRAAGCMWDTYGSTTRVKSAIVFSFMVDGSGYCGCPIFGRLRPARSVRTRGRHATSTRSVERSANRPTGGARNTRQPLPIGDVDEFAKRTGEDRAFQAGAPGTGALGPAGSRMRASACR